MIFKDAAGLSLPLEVMGWTPTFQPKFRAQPLEHQDFEVAAHQAAPSPLNALREPTQAQKEAGNYRKGHVNFQGMPIAIENPRGSIRSGPGWSVTMAHHYGYLERTTGADHEGVDVFVGPDLESDLVTVVNQVNPDGSFDEHKLMLGFGTENEARRGYLASYTPGWTGMGSTWTCDVDDLKDWLEFGDLSAPAGRGVMKANPGDIRWITVHPNGKDEPGRPVQIRQVAGHTGVFHIVGGADGKLNGLRLQGIKDPAQYKAESKGRAKEIKKANKAKQEAKQALLTDDEKAKRAEEGDSAKKRVEDAKDALIRATLHAQGINPDEAMDLPGVDSKLAQSKHRGELLSHAMKAAKDAERRITLDADARTRAGCATVGGDNQPSADEILALTDQERGPGYQRALGQKAKEAGLTAGKLADAVADLKTKQAENRVAEGDFTEAHTKLGDGDPVLGIQLAGAKMGELNREAHMKAKALKNANNGAIKESLKQAVTDNEQLAAILRARKELREAVKSLKKGKASIFEQGYQTHIEDLDEAIIQDAEDALRTDHMSGFLDEVEEAHPEDQETMDMNTAPNEDGLHASRGAGAFDALHEVALASLGQGAIDRETVEILGPEGGALILARALRHIYTPAEQKEIMAALEEVHLEEQGQELTDVMENASALRTEANAVQEDLASTPRDLATAAEMHRNKVDLLREARHPLGGFLGRLEARAALIMALKDAPKETMTVPLGRLSKESAVITAAAMGLKEGDFSLD